MAFVQGYIAYKAPTSNKLEWHVECLSMGQSKRPTIDTGKYFKKRSKIHPYIYIYIYIEPTTLIWHPNQTKSKFLSLLPHTLFTFATFFPPFSAVIVGAALLFA